MIWCKLWLFLYLSCFFPSNGGRQIWIWILILPVKSISTCILLNFVLTDFLIPKVVAKYSRRYKVRYSLTSVKLGFFCSGYSFRHLWKTVNKTDIPYSPTTWVSECELNCCSYQMMKLWMGIRLRNACALTKQNKTK